jgi:hypothetical protein
VIFYPVAQSVVQQPIQKRQGMYCTPLYRRGPLVYCSGDYRPFGLTKTRDFHVVLSLPNNTNGATSVSITK